MARRPTGAREFGLFQLWLTSRPESNGFGAPANICRSAQLTGNPSDPRLERPDGTAPADGPRSRPGAATPAGRWPAAPRAAKDAAVSPPPADPGPAPPPEGEVLPRASRATDARPPAGARWRGPRAAGVLGE